MKYQIAQKLLQTDWYEIEANSPEEALKIYEESIGTLNSSGFTSGWIGNDNEEIVVLDPNNDK